MVRWHELRLKWIYRYWTSAAGPCMLWCALPPHVQRWCTRPCKNAEWRTLQSNTSFGWLPRMAAKVGHWWEWGKEGRVRGEGEAVEGKLRIAVVLFNRATSEGRGLSCTDVGTVADGGCPIPSSSADQGAPPGVPLAGRRLRILPQCDCHSKHVLQ